MAIPNKRPINRITVGDSPSQKRSLNIRAGLAQQDSSMIFQQDYSFMKDLSTSKQASKNRILDYHTPTIITTARETKTSNFFFDKRLSNQGSAGNLKSGQTGDYVEKNTPVKRISNKLHSILGIKRDDQTSRFNESSSAKTASRPTDPSQKRTVKKKHPIESLVLTDHQLIDTNTLRKMQSTHNTPIKKAAQSTTGLNLMELPSSNKWHTSMGEDGLTLDKIKKSANFIAAGIIKNKESIKLNEKMSQNRGGQSSNNTFFTNRNSPSKSSKYARQAPFLSLSSLNARKKSLEYADGGQSKSHITDNPVMGIAGQKMQLQNLIPEHLLQHEDFKYINLQAQQGIQKGTSKGVGMTPPEPEQNHNNSHVKVFLKQVQSKAEGFYNNNDNNKSYFVMPKALNHKTPQLIINRNQINKESARENIIIDSNVENSKSLERLVDILETARIKEQQSTSNYLKKVEKDKNHHSRVYNNVRSTSSNNNTVYLNHDSESEMVDELYSHITPKKQKFIVKISTPMPQRMKMVQVPKLNLVRQTKFQSLEGIHSQNIQPAVVNWPLQYSDYSRYQAQLENSYRSSRQQQQQSYEPWVDQHIEEGTLWYETFNQSNNNNYS